MLAPTFRAMLKPLDVEEPIDVALHRPLAYLITRAVYETPVTPDQITWASLFVGVAAGLATWSSFALGAPRLALGGALLIFSAVLDCSDGQLARLRGESSSFGRMLDGAVDAIVQAAVVPAAVAHVWWKHGGVSSPSAWWWLAAAIPAVVTGLAHTILYDHYKNVYLHHIQAQRKEGDDPEDIEAAFAPMVDGPRTVSDWLRFHIAKPYLIRQRALLSWLDPYIPARFRDMPAYTVEGAARYRGAERWLMRAWSFYGIGTHIFGLGVAMMFDAVEVYLVVRLVLFNAALLVLLPAQRRASRGFFQGASA